MFIDFFDDIGALTDVAQDSCINSNSFFVKKILKICETDEDCGNCKLATCYNKVFSILLIFEYEHMFYMLGKRNRFNVSTVS